MDLLASSSLTCSLLSALGKRILTSPMPCAPLPQKEPLKPPNAKCQYPHATSRSNYRGYLGWPFPILEAWGGDSALLIPLHASLSGWFQQGPWAPAFCPSLATFKVARGKAGCVSLRARSLEPVFSNLPRQGPSRGVKSTGLMATLSWEEEGKGGRPYLGPWPGSCCRSHQGCRARGHTSTPAGLRPPHSCLHCHSQ